MNFNKFRKFIIEALVHQELKEIIQAPHNAKVKKIHLITKKIKDIVNRGESTGLESNMPKGSSRAFLPHEEPHRITIDGRPLQEIKVGTKVAITCRLDKHHNAKDFEGLKMGALQNRAEGDKRNDKFRILIKDEHNPDQYTTNEKYGVLPPLIDYDNIHHEWIQTGFCSNIVKNIKNPNSFNAITKDTDFPKGISHLEFYKTLNRWYRKFTGKYWDELTPAEEKNFDKLENHPLIYKFIAFHRTMGENPYDYEQISNLGIFVHPVSKKQYIVARDHGFSNEVQTAYGRAIFRECKVENS